MTAKYEQPRSKRDINSTEESSGHLSPYNLRKKLKSSHCQHSSQSQSTVLSSLEFPPRSQEELKKIFGPRRHRSISLTFDSEESEESEEEGLSEEEQKKTEGYKLLMTCFHTILGKKPLTTS